MYNCDNSRGRVDRKTPIGFLEMVRRCFSYSFLILLLGCCSYAYAQHAKSARLVSTSSHCAVTPFVKDFPPRGPRVNNDWFANHDRTMWAFFWGWDFVRGPDKPDPKTGYKPGQKVLWYKPPYPLIVTGRRTDGPAPPLVLDISRDPRPRGTMQPSGVYFPAAGCWTVNATAGPSKLHFVVLVKNPVS